MSSLTAAQFRSLIEMAGGDDLSFLFNNFGDEPPAPAPATTTLGKRAWEEVAGSSSAPPPPAKWLRSPTSSRENSIGSNEGGDVVVIHDQEVAMAAAAAAAGKGGGRRLWVRERDSEWWDTVSSPDYPDSEFKKSFKMSKATFAVVCDELAAAVAKEDTMLRAAIPVKKRVAVCVWRLATGEPLRLVSKRFGLGISTCHKLVLEVCAALKSMVMPKVVLWPESPAAAAAGFESISGIAGIVGAIYTTHVPIIAPKSNVASYYNRRHTERNQKTSYSMTVQCVVDSTGAFTDVCIGWPGSNSDEEVLEKSALFLHRGEAGLIGRGNWVVGGGSYPLMDWMLVPYTHQNLTWAQHVLNEKLAAVRGLARGAFERLKRRWGCLQKRTEVKLLDLPTVLGACCVLHNICERRGDAVDVDGDGEGFELFDDEMVAENAVRSPAAARARDAIAHNLLHSGGGASFF